MSTPAQDLRSSLFYGIALENGCDEVECDPPNRVASAHDASVTAFANWLRTSAAAREAIENGMTHGEVLETLARIVESAGLSTDAAEPVLEDTPIDDFHPRCERCVGTTYVLRTRATTNGPMLERTDPQGGSRIPLLRYETRVCCASCGYPRFEGVPSSVESEARSRAIDFIPPAIEEPDHA